jgi:hypothetical protein
MSENIELKDPLFKLSVRFGNGEVVSFIADSPINTSQILPETRYAIITSISVANPNECAETTVINLRDVTFIRTERVTLDQLTSERRTIRSVGPAVVDDRLPKMLSQVKFV